MARIVEVRNWGRITHEKKISVFYIRVKEESKIYEIAERLNLPHIFKQGDELMCTDGRLLYWYKPK